MPRLPGSADGADTAHDPGRDEANRVIAWRAHLLLSAGFGDRLAHRLAGTAGIDVHELLNLVDRGCPPRLAARILAPVMQGPPTAGRE